MRARIQKGLNAPHVTHNGSGIYHISVMKVMIIVESISKVEPGVRQGWAVWVRIITTLGFRIELATTVDVAAPVLIINKLGLD